MIPGRPGSTLWLLRHELRLHWRGSGLRPDKLSLWHIPIGLFYAGVAVALQLIGLAVADTLTGGAFSLAEQLVMASLALAFVAIMMLSWGIRHAIETLYQRRDLDWLLTSPISLPRLLAIRLLGMAASMAGGTLLLLGPLANAMPFFGRPGLLALYPVVICLALLATSLAAAITILLVPRFGLARTRGLVTVLGIAAGALPFLGNAYWPSLRGNLGHMFSLPCCTLPTGLGWWPARAVLGDPLPLAVVLALGIGIALGAGWALSRHFLAGVIQAPSGGSAARLRTGAAPRLRGGLRAVLLRKEIRLLRRMPGLLGKAAQNLVFFIPLAIPLWHGGGRSSLHGLAIVSVFIAGELAHQFITAAVAGDAAADLASSAPVAAKTIRAAKRAACGIGVAVFMSVPVLALAWLDPALLPALLFGLAGVTFTELRLGVRRATPTRKADIGAASVSQGRGVLLGLAIETAWGLLTWLAIKVTVALS